MSLSAYPTEPIHSITGQDIEIPVTMVAPLYYNSRYDNIGRVRIILDGVQIASSGAISLFAGTSQSIVIIIPGSGISLGTQILTLITELRYEFDWLNDGNYQVTVIINSPCNIPICNLRLE